MAMTDNDKFEMQNKIEVLEAQLSKARLLSDEQNQQISWLNQYYRDELDQLKQDKGQFSSPEAYTT